MYLPVSSLAAVINAFWFFSLLLYASKILSHESVSRVGVGTSPTCLSLLALGAAISSLPLLSHLGVASEKGKGSNSLVNPCRIPLNLWAIVFSCAISQILIFFFLSLGSKRHPLITVCCCLKFLWWNCCILMPVQSQESYWYSLYQILHNLHVCLVFFFVFFFASGKHVRRRTC